jgi:hypothetical protein
MALLRRVLPVLIVLLPALGCRSGGATDFGRVFEGFDFIGAEPLTSVVASTMASKGDSSPKLYKPGFRYVFRSSGPISLPQIATVVLPSRLHTAGVTLVSFPHSENDMAAASFGTPAWEIKFMQGSHEGRIFNRFNRQLAELRRTWPSGSHDDYVLELAK